MRYWPVTLGIPDPLLETSDWRQMRVLPRIITKRLPRPSAPRQVAKYARLKKTQRMY